MMNQATLSQREGWLLDCPAPEGGILSSTVYNAGPGLADDSNSTTAEDCPMQMLADVRESDYALYQKKLQQAGFRCILEHNLGENRFSTFTAGEQIIHTSFWSKAGEMRILLDNCSVPLDRFTDPSAGNEATTLYQYGLYYDPENRVTDRTVNCGMLYIIKLSDNRLFLIDGGHRFQSTDEASEALWQFLREITGLKEGEPLRIAAWHITHAHSDHLEGCSKLLHRHHNEIVLERMMFNFPSYQVHPKGYELAAQQLKSIVRRYYPDVAFLKPHTGQKFSLSDVEVEVLYTHEDVIPFENPTVFPFKSFNCTSSVLKLKINGQRVLFLADIHTDSEGVIIARSESSVWKADVVQVAHHCFNYLDTLYSWIAAPIALLPNSYFGAHTPDNTPKLAAVLKYLEQDQIYYEGDATYGFQVQGNRFACIDRRPVIGGEYDGSEI